MPSDNPPRLYTIPLYTVLSIAAFYFVAVHMVASEATVRFKEVHEASPVPMTVTGVAPLDKPVVPLVSFFVSAFGDPKAVHYYAASEFVWSLSIGTLILFVESCRGGVTPNHILYYPTIWAIFAQRLPAAFVKAIWFGVFMNSRPHTDTADVNPDDASSVLVGWWLGSTLPAVIMLFPNQPEMSTAPAWIAFPILIGASALGWRTLLKVRPVDHPISGRGYLYLAYFSGFIISLIGHYHLIVSPLLYSSPTPVPIMQNLRHLISSLYNLYVPDSIFPPDKTTTTATLGIQRFVQWDSLISFGVIWLSGVWDITLRRKEERQLLGSAFHKRVVLRASSHFSEDFQFAVLLAGVLFVSFVILGPGPPTAVLWAYREYQIGQFSKSKLLVGKRN